MYRSRQNLPVSKPEALTIPRAGWPLRFAGLLAAIILLSHLSESRPI